MKSLNKKVITFLSIALFLTVIPVGASKATLQANPNTHVKKTDILPNWIKKVRNMEKSGESMGLNEKIGTNLTAESESNNIDVHMVRSTEYGACAILSASGYGNPQILQESEIKTTTGNKTGVYFTGGAWECVAGGDSRNSSGISPIYYDCYDKTAKTGDAMGTATIINPGCSRWHKSGQNSWIRLTYVDNFFRGGAGLFSFNYYGISTSGGTTNFSRGVAVCGEGL